VSGAVKPLTTLVKGNVFDGYVHAGAEISKCGKYRYRLWREWRGFATDDNWHRMGDGKDDLDGAGNRMGWPKSVVFVMLNPSTADGEIDDPTIRRCVGFAKSWGYDRLEVINLFAYRATSPADLLALGHDDDPVGIDNQRHVSIALDDAGLVVCAWGVHGAHLCQDETTLGWIHDQDCQTWALKLTKNGHPSHPLYLPAHLQPFVWTPS
jgi:hypothetical protein